MAVTNTVVTGIEWNVSRGVVAGEEALNPTPDPNSATGFVNPTEFQWENTTARLIGGPEPLTDFWVEGRVYMDTRTITTADPPAENAGEVTSDVVTRSYPAWSLESMTFTSNLTDDWVDSTNPAKPKQYEGPILFKLNDLVDPVAMNSAGYSRVGIQDNGAQFLGFVNGEQFLPDVPGPAGDESFYIDLETGNGFCWSNTLPGAATPGMSPRWANCGVAKDPAEINTDALDSVDDLDMEAAVGTWQLVNTGTYGTVYAKTEDGWLNIGPLQLGGSSPIVVIPEGERKRYVSGYIYSLVFDQSRFAYVPRMSGETQDTYEGEISITETGWFPDTPHDPERDIYPMDSVTRVRPDGRESVTATYTTTLTTTASYTDPTTLLPVAAPVVGTCTIYQDVYQPTYNWGDLIHQLLDLTYFAHGIYH